MGNTGGGQKYPYNPFYGAFSPRIAAAWNPSYSDGLLGKVFGQGKTVIRGGYSRIFGRLNGVDLVLVPLLGTGLIQPVQCIDAQSPTVGIANTTAPAQARYPANAFRIGTDGMTAPIPDAQRNSSSARLSRLQRHCRRRRRGPGQQFPARRIGPV